MRFKRSNISWYVFEPTSHCLLLDHDTDQNLNWMPIPSNLGRNSPKNKHPESEPAFLPCARAHVARTTTACSPRWRNNQRVQNQQRRCTRFFQMWKRFHFTLAQRMTKILNTCWAHFEGWVCSWSIRSMSRQNCQTCQTFPSSSPAHCSMLCWLFETSTSTFTMSIHLKPFRYCRLCHWVLEWLKVVAVITSSLQDSRKNASCGKLEMPGHADVGGIQIPPMTPESRLATGLGQLSSGQEGI